MGPHCKRFFAGGEMEKLNQKPQQITGRSDAIDKQWFGGKLAAFTLTFDKWQFMRYGAGGNTKPPALTAGTETPTAKTYDEKEAKKEEEKREASI